MNPLEALAQAAAEHARREHGCALDPEAADRILRAEGAADPARRESLAACYGAWLGELAVRELGAIWTGVDEPAAPRLRLGRRLASPIDAVRRRLADPFAPSLPSVFSELRRLAAPPDRDGILAANAAAWDALADDPRFAGPMLLPQQAEDALDDWVRAEGVKDKDLLCLGAGGGRQGRLHAAAGARVVVVDLSERQLEHDRRQGLRVVRASIDRLEGIPDASFDLVIQPVSSCYVPDVLAVYREVARVLRKGGLYVSQHKQPGAPADPGTREFAHPLEDLVGGLCRTGYAIEDLREPPRGDALAPPGSPEREAELHPPYLKIKARRT